MNVALTRGLLILRCLPDSYIGSINPRLALALDEVTYLNFLATLKLLHKSASRQHFDHMHKSMPTLQNGNATSGVYQEAVLNLGN